MEEQSSTSHQPDQVERMTERRRFMPDRPPIGYVGLLGAVFWWVMDGLEIPVWYRIVVLIVLLAIWLAWRRLYDCRYGFLIVYGGLATLVFGGAYLVLSERRISEPNPVAVNEQRSETESETQEEQTTNTFIGTGNIPYWPVTSSKPNFHERWALIVYDLTIHNSSGHGRTFRDVLLVYETSSGTYSTGSSAWPTGTVRDSDRPYIVVASTKQNIFAGWTDLREKLVERELVPPGGVLFGSVVFLLERGIEPIDIRRTALKIVDYGGTSEEFEIEAVDFQKDFDKGLRLMHSRFDNDPTKGIEFFDLERVN